jgi:hypothetical protein
MTKGEYDDLVAVVRGAFDKATSEGYGNEHGSNRPIECVVEAMVPLIRIGCQPHDFKIARANYCNLPDACTLYTMLFCSKCAVTTEIKVSR